jgi:hypothetical protein
MRDATTGIASTRNSHTDPAMSHDTPLRSHDYTEEELAAALDPWPSFDHARTTRTFKRAAAITRAAEASVEHLHQASPYDLTSGRLKPAEAAFWLSLLIHPAPFDGAEDPSADEREAWVHAHMDDVPADDPAAALGALTEHGALDASRPRDVAAALGRFVGVLAPWIDAFALACEAYGHEIMHLGSFAEGLGECPEEDRARALALADACFPLPRTLHPWSYFRLCAWVPCPRGIEGWAGSFQDGDTVHDGNGVVDVLYAQLPSESFFALMPRVVTRLTTRHVRVVFARHGHDGVGLALERFLANPYRRPTAELADELARIHAPEVAAALYAVTEVSPALSQHVDGILEGYPVAPLAAGLVTLCGRADAAREWATPRLRVLVAHDEGRAAIERALGDATAGQRGFVEANILDADAPMSAGDVPDWARRLTELGAEPPPWLPRSTLPLLVTAEGEKQLPNTTSLGWTRAFVAGDDLTDFEARVTRGSLARLAFELFDQWYGAAKKPSQDPGFLAARAAFARHPSAESLELAETYLRKTSPPARKKDPKTYTDEVARLLCGIHTPDAYALLLRLKKNVKRFRVKEIVSAGIEEHIAREGVSAREFLDMAAPTFGLDARGGRDFDYGPRTIRMQLAPDGVAFVDTSSGKSTTRPPKPRASDDHDLATAAHGLMSATSKALRDELVTQRVRVEGDLVRQARWSLAHWRERVLPHPLLGPMCRALVWTLIAPDGANALVRPTEGGELIDASMDDVGAPEGSEVALTHPLHMSDAQLQAWTAHVLEFELVQPFDQLGRALHDVGDPEVQALILALEARERLVDLKTLRHLDRQTPLRLKMEEYDSDWARTRFELPVEPAVEVAFTPEDKKRYAFGSIHIRPRSTNPDFYYKGSQPMTYADIDPLLFSEAIRYLEMASAPA